MIAAIMQPYFFPYIGYFQLMAAVDVFIFHDDVQYIKSGWINRNRILGKATSEWWTMPVSHASHDAAINCRWYQVDREKRRSLLHRLQSRYQDAPYFNLLQHAIDKWMEIDDLNVARFNQSHLIAIARTLGISCSFELSSKLPKDDSLRGQSRVIDICQRVGATRYLNPIGGLELYDEAAFEEAGVELGFVKARTTSYRQFGEEHVPFLSILDVLSFNDDATVSTMLRDFDLVAPRTDRGP